MNDEVWKMNDESWKMNDESWKMKDEGRKMKDEGWILKDWRIQVEGDDCRVTFASEKIIELGE